MDDRLSIAVLVPTLRRPDQLRACLEGLARQTRAPDRVIVVAREDDEQSAAVLAEPRGELRVDAVPVHATGQVAALNAGRAAAQEDIVAITDDDAVPRPDWVEQVGRHFAADPRLGGLGGRDWVHHDGVLETGELGDVGRLRWYGRFVGLHHLGAGEPREVDFLKGANMSYRRAALPEFDTALRGRGAEHVNDWVVSMAVRRAGWRLLYDPAVAIDHYEGDRGELDPRQSADLSVAGDFAHNQTYAAVRHLAAPRAASHLLFALLVGTTAAPGIGMTARNLARGDAPGPALRALRGSLAARAAGARTALRARRS